jgi:hypothetical protein
MGYGARWNHRECIRISRAKAEAGAGASRQSCQRLRWHETTVIASVLTLLALMPGQALAQPADAGAPEGQPSGSVPRAPGGQASKEVAPAFPPKLIDPSMLSERVLGRVGSDMTRARLGAPLLGEPAEPRNAPKRRTLAIETQDGMTVLSNHARSGEARPVRAEAAPAVPSGLRPAGETILEPRQSTRTHSLRASSNAVHATGSQSLGWATPLLLLLAGSSLVGALWCHKRAVPEPGRAGAHSRSR